MAEPDRRPSAEEIEELIDLVRRDPSSPAFVDLGDAYLALGRARDAVEVGTAGLAGSDSIEGRVMLARALVALHQWKEAQAELLRVVKTDRGNRLGFVLLGEVLMRRSDYERALPVLQHAQNLDPANPEVLVMLKRARQSQPLDPPPPIPTPQSPAPRAARPAPPSGRPGPKSAPPPAPGRRPAPGELVAAEAAMRGDPTELAPPPVWDDPPKARPAAGSMPLAAPSAQGSVDGAVPRPRVIPAAKPVNAAAASLRQSAAVGEQFLNDLLTGGLLDVPGVSVPEVEFDIKPDRRWGRSTSRAFIALFVTLFIGVGGGVGWYFWTEHNRKEAIAQHRAKAAEVVTAATWDGFEQALAELRGALAEEPSSTLTMAQVAEVAALETLLYGTDDDRVDTAIKVAARDIDQPTEAGYRELLIARAAVELSRLSTLEAPATVLADVRTRLDAWLANHGDDGWARWLAGRAMLAAGERTAAHAALTQAQDGPRGAVVAMIDRADLLADEGKYDEAIKLHEQALTKVADHPLALLGRALARAERGTDAAAVMDDLNVRLDKQLGPRVAAYRQLALAMAHYALEDYVRFRESLAAATGPHDARFHARIAQARILAGDLAAAAEARSKVAWYGKDKPETDPLVALVDAALLVASGLPAKALDLAKGDSVRAMLLRGQALLDLGRAKDSLAELDRALAAAPESIEVQVQREHARVMASAGKERAAALEALEKVSRKAKSKIGRHALGAALLATGNAAEAKKRLEQAITDVTDEAPNPIAYRTRTLLAEIELAAGNLDGAATQIEEATRANPGYLPALALRSRVVLAKGDPDQALDLLRPVVKESFALNAALELTLAEALIRHKGATEQDRADAVSALQRAKALGAAPEEIGRIAFLIDPALPEKLEVPVPKAEGAPAPAKAKAKAKSRDRGKRRR
jgi:tetratricopeptide (TPR) repeat protein